MRRLVVNTFLTLDGVMQGPGGPEEDPTGGFTHGGWSVNYWDEQMGQRMGEFMGKPFDLLLGRKTYEVFASHWPYSEEPGADSLNNAGKYVASRTLKRVDWKNSQLLQGDVGKAVEELKRQDGPAIQVHCSSNLIQTLLKHDLVDEFGIWIFPVVIGSGKRLFGEGAIPRGLQLLDSASFSTGVTYSRYQRAGGLEYGTFELKEPSPEELERREKLQGQG